MAEENLRGIKNSWSLVAFRRLKGVPRPNTSKDKDGQPFHNLVFTDEAGNFTFVSFSSKLGVLEPAEIQARKDELQVIQLNDDPETGKEGGYQLCRAGNLNLGEAFEL